MVSAPGLPLASVEVLASLAQHRLLTTDQVRAIHRLGTQRRWAQKVLARLSAAGFADCVRPPGSAARAWFATERGHGIARRVTGDDAQPVLGPKEAAGQLQAHTLAVNEAAICFLQAARDRGDEFGPLSWRHEAFHPMGGGRGRRRRALSADAVLTYLRSEGGRVALEQRFLELDRATLSVERLAAQLARYAKLESARDGEGEPLWRSSYPRFPGVICVLAGAPRAVLERRRTALLALLQADPEVSRARTVRVSTCLLEDLRREGPFAPIFLELRRKGPVDWLGGGGEVGR